VEGGLKRGRGREEEGGREGVDEEREEAGVSQKSSVMKELEGREGGREGGVWSEFSALVHLSLVFTHPGRRTYRKGGREGRRGWMIRQTKGEELLLCCSQPSFPPFLLPFLLLFLVV